jgi:predicted extracellular nuclease
MSKPRAQRFVQVNQNELIRLSPTEADYWSVADAFTHRGLADAGAPKPQTAAGPVPEPTVPPTISLSALDSAYTQNFDTLSNTAGSTTNVLSIDGWSMTETGGGARDNEQYAVDTGGSTTGDTYSYGSAAATDRALGELRSGTLIPNFGASFTNNSGSTITSLTISYDGEQWRFGGVHSTVADKLDFQISFDATSLTTGTWTDIDALDFLPPVTTGTAGALDGNLAANRVSISSTILSLAIASGQTFWIRWQDTDATGADDGLAVDNFSITPHGAAAGQTQTVTFSPTTVSHAEGNSGTTAYTFTITRSGGSTGQLDFSGTIAAGGTDGTDFVGGVAPTAFSGSIAAGQTSATVTVNVQGDFTIEGDENFTLTLTNATNTDGSVTVNIGAAHDAIGTITNDDAAGAFSVADVSIAEGDAGTTPGTFTVTRTGGSSGSVDVAWTIHLPGGAGGADGSDVSGPLTGTVHFDEGQTSATIPFTINGDTVNEPNETFTVTLDNASASVGTATISDGTGVATITNDDALPAASVADVAVAEGNAGVSYLVFTVTLDKASSGTLTYDFQTSPGSAAAGSDYLEVSGTVTFAPGVTSQTISVPIIGDTVPENNETLTVALSNPSGGTIADGSATGTLTNDDGPQYFALAGGDFTQDWSNTGLITTNDDWSGVPYIIGYRGDDLTTATNTDPRTITTTSNVIDVIANQTNPNTNTSGGVAEFFDAANIPNATIALQGSGTADAPYIVLFMDATGRSDIRLQANLRDIDGSADNAVQQINVQYRIDPNGPWINVTGGYFADATTGPSATQTIALDVTLPPEVNGVASVQIRVMTTNAVGNDEWVGIDDIHVSSQPSGSSLSIADTAVFEGDAGTTPISFTVTRAGDSSGAVDATYTVSFGNGPFDAQANDFAPSQPLTGTVHFDAGQTSQVITLDVQGDLVAEGDDSFTVTLTNPSAGTIADGVAIGTIVNDDGPPSLVTVNDVTVTEGDAGTSQMVFTITRTGGTGAFDVNYHTADGTGIQPGDYLPASGTVHFADGETTQTVSVTINGDTEAELSETLQLVLDNPTNGALVTDAIGIGTIAGDDPIYIHQIQGNSYFSPILAAEGIHSFNTASAGTVIVRAIVTAVDDDGPRQGFYLQEEVTDWDGNSFTSEGIFVMTRDDHNVGTAVTGIAVGDLVTVTAHVMEYQGFANNMPITALTSPSSIIVNSTGNPLPVFTLDASHPIPNETMTGVTPDYFDSSDGAGDSFDATNYSLSFFETVEGMLVKIPDMVVADGFITTSGGQPIFQAYSTVHANPEQINSRGGYTIAGDPPIGPAGLHTADPNDDTHNGGRVLHDGDVNPDVIEVDFSGFATPAPAGLTQTLSMGDHLGDLTGIIEFDFTDRKLFVTDYDAGTFTNTQPALESTALGGDDRALTVATFNVNNLDPSDGAARFTAIANAIATNLHAPDILSIEEMQDNNGAAAGDGISPTGSDASTTWQMLVDALNLATGAHYQWVDQAPVYNAEGGEPNGNIRVGFIYNTDRVQLGDLAPDATLAERREYVDRIGDGVRDPGDLIQFSDDMLGAEINTNDWSNTRKSLLGQFTFHGNTVFVTANHFPAKGGSGSFWQFDQTLESGEPNNSGWAQRNQVAQDVYSMLNLVQAGAPNAGVVSGGDYNDFYFYRPLTTVTGYTMADGTARVGGARFDNLTLTLPEAERYSYAFDGRNQAIDHIIVNDLMAGIASYDVVHINTGYNPLGTGADANPALSDHDPAVSSYNFRELAETLTGTAGDDVINGFGGDDRIFGLGGNDTLIGGTGADTMTGGSGNDFYLVDNAADVIVEGTGEGAFDIVFTTVSYTLGAAVEAEAFAVNDLSSTGALNLTGNGFSQVIYGNAGANLIVGGGGEDTMIGLGGNDTYLVDSVSDIIVDRAGEGAFDSVYTTVSFALAADAEIEVFAVNDLSTTNAVTMVGNGFSQVIYGNAGANLIVGGGGEDTMIGLGGNDTYLVDSVSDIIVDRAGEGAFDSVYTTINYALGANVEIELFSANDQNGTGALNLTGNGFSQIIVGNAGANVLIGGGGDDTLYGLAGNDTYLVDSQSDAIVDGAGQGTDALYTLSSYALGANAEIELFSANDQAGMGALNLSGNGFSQIIIGNAGANVIDGGAGADTLYGLGGADSFAFTTALGGNNVDAIADFVSGTDRILLGDAVFTALGAHGVLNPNAFFAGTAAHDADDRIIYDAATGNLYYDADGNGAGAQVLFATLQTHPAITASDFQVI